MMKNYFFKVLVFIVSVCFMSFIPIEEHKIETDNPINTPLETNYNFGSSSDVSVDDMGFSIDLPPCGSINGIYIYDQNTDQAVLGPITNNQEISINSLPDHYYLVAETSGSVGSVYFTVDGTSITENVELYTYPAGADSNNGWNAILGSHSVDAEAYPEDNRNGVLCDSVHITFTLTGDNVVNPPTAPNCDAGDLIWTNNVTVNGDGSVNADVRFINGGNITIPGPYPAALSGPSIVNINEAISWDGYTSRVNVTQEFEQWRIVFLKNGIVQYSSNFTEDPADNVASAEWIGALDQNINLPNGADQIVLAHIEDSQYGEGSRSSANSVVPSSICISVEGVTVEPPTPPTCDAGDFIWTNNVTVNSDGSVNADVRFINGGNFTVPGPYPEELSGPSTVNINEAISWDGYANRVNVNQEFEQWRIVFLKNGVVQYSSQLTEDTPDLVASGEWIGALDQNIELPNGADQIILAHIEDGEYGDGSRSSSNSVVPSSICISAEAICDLTVDAGDAIEVCENETVELTATAENANVCEGGCEYPIIESVRCNNSNMAEIWISNAGQDHFNTTLNSSFEVLDNGVATYSSRVSNGTDILDVSLTFSGRTTTPPTGSPKLGCDTGNTSDYVYWTSTSGTIVSQQHGTFQVSRMGEAFQLGLGGDVTREGFGASGWLTITGGDGYYERGDINIKLGECNPIGGDSTVEYVWTTEDGNIVGDPNQNTITVDQSGTYKVVAKDCKDCEAEDEVVVNLLEKVVIGNFVWVDVNENGLQDDGATGVNGVNVTLFQANGTEVASTTTANDPNSGDAGYYEFEVCPDSGEYYIVFDNIPDGFEITDQNVGGDDAVDSDINPNGRTDDFTITTEDDLTLDAGIFLPKASLGDTVFLDENENGIQDDGEEGVEGVVVNLLDCDGNELDSTMTDENGNYSFTELDPNVDYVVEFELPDGYEFSPVDQGADDTADSDAGEDGRTPCTDLAPGENNPTLDAGIFLPKASLGDTVFLDENENGIQDDGEEGVEGVVVNLLDCDGNELDSTMTDENGNYSFTELDPNVDYVVEFELPDGYEFSPVDQGADDTADSDAGEDGRTPCTDLAPGENNPTLDAGIFLPKASLGDTVFLDENENGIQDDGEEGVEGVVVNLLDCDGNELDSTMTDENGNYSFTELDPNVDYVVEFELPDGYEFSPVDQGADDTADSDAGEDGRTPCTDLAPGENNPTLDAGIFLPCDINPEVTLLADPICQGTEITLTATGGDQFVWKLNDEVIDGQTASTLTVTPNVTSTYAVVVTDSSQFECFAEVSTVVTVNPVTPDVVTETTVCEGAEYVWDFNGETYTAADSPVVLDLTDDNGCPYTATLTINEYPVTPDVVAETTVCEGAEFIWDFNGLTYTAADSPVVLDVTDDNGCPYTATLTINEYPVTPDVVAETTVCEGAEYVWDFNGETYTAADSPVVLDLTDDNGCPYTATLTINEYPVTPDVVAETTVCEGAEFIWDFNGLTYTAADSPVVLDVTDDNGCPYTATLTINEYPVTPDVVAETTVCEGAEYVWDFNGETYTAADSPVVLDLTDDNGCPYTATLTINEYPVTPDVVAETTVCESAEYVWDFNGETYTAADSPIVLDLTDDNGCPYTATLTINEYPVTPDVVAETTVCESAEYVWDFNGETYTAADSPVVLDLTDDNGCPYTATLTINEYPVTPDETIEETVCQGEAFIYEGNEYTVGSYDFPQTDDNGCPYLITLVVKEFDVTMVDAGDDVTICIGDEIMLTASGDGTFEWSTGETGASIMVSPSVDTTYTVTATSEEGCEAEDTVTVFVNEKVTIGDYVFEDANFNGIQDDMDTGVNGVTVMLYTCSDQGNTNGMFVESILTSNNPITGEPGYYSFEVCPNSGPYYLTFSDIPKDYEFTEANIGDDALDSDVNYGGITDCFEIGDMDDTTRDAGIINPSCRITIGNKILPKYPSNTWIEQNSDTACIGDSFLLWVAKDPSNFGNSSTYNGEDFVGYTFTYTTPTGDVTTYSDSSQSSYRFEVLGLDEEDFGIYTVTYSGPDGCAGTMEFELTLGDECLEDGTRPSDFTPINPIASIFPVPATSGSTLTIVINTENGRINTNSDINSTNLSAMLPANKENIGISLFDKNGRMVNPVRTYDITKGSDVVEYPLEYLSSGTYILRVDGKDWSDSKQVIIK